MDELIAFLKARLAEDELVAADATGWWGKSWHTVPVGPEEENYSGQVRVRAEGLDITSDIEMAEGTHIARWDPARALAEFEAKALLLTAYRQARDVTRPAELLERLREANDVPVSHAVDTGVEFGLRAAVKLMATAYADHPDYRAEWAPPVHARGGRMT